MLRGHHSTPSQSKGSMQIKKCPKPVKKSIIFLMFWTLLNLGNVENLMTPPPLDLIWDKESSKVLSDKTKKVSFPYDLVFWALSNDHSR